MTHIFQGCSSLPHKTIQYTSRYRGSDTIQGRYISITGRFGAIRCNKIQNNCISLRIFMERVNSVIYVHMFAVDVDSKTCCMNKHFDIIHINCLKQPGSGARPRQLGLYETITSSQWGVRSLLLISGIHFIMSVTIVLPVNSQRLQKSTWGCYC